MSRSFVLPYVPPGSNQLHRMHHHAVARHRRQVRDDVTMLTRPIKPLIRSARVTYDVFWKTNRRRDPHNVVEGLKPALDALVGRWLVDDDQVELVVRGWPGAGSDEVRVTVEAMG